jgi:thiol-disulfide isomerase/thioredoxin
MANENRSKRPRGAFMALVVFGFTLGLVGVLYSPEDDLTTSALIGSEAPAFEFETLGRRESLLDLRGKVVLINFWASWCAPCLEEMGSLIELEKKLADRNFVLLMIHVGEDKEDALKVGALPQRVVFDVLPSVLSDYSVSALPHSVLIDKDGTVIQEFKGPRDWVSQEVLGQIQDLFETK